MIKDEVIKIITNMEDDISLDEVMYQLYILDKHNKARDDTKGGRLYTTNDVIHSLNMP